MLLLLEGRGLVARQRHPADGRAPSVTLTASAGRLTQVFDRDLKPKPAVAAVLDVLAAP